MEDPKVKNSNQKQKNKNNICFLFYNIKEFSRF